MLIAAREKIDAKCMTLIIGKAEGLKEGAQKTEGSKKNAEAVVSAYPNGQASAQKIKPTSDTYDIAKSLALKKICDMHKVSAKVVKW